MKFVVVSLSHFTAAYLIGVVAQAAPVSRCQLESFFAESVQYGAMTRDVVCEGPELDELSPGYHDGDKSKISYFSLTLSRETGETAFSFGRSVECGSPNSNCAKPVRVGTIRRDGVTSSGLKCGLTSSSGDQMNINFKIAALVTLANGARSELMLYKTGSNYSAIQKFKSSHCVFTLPKFYPMFFY